MVVTHSAAGPRGLRQHDRDRRRPAPRSAACPRPIGSDRGGGWVQAREFRKGGLTILGFEGAGPEDHMRHLRRIAEAWKVAKGRPRRARLNLRGSRPISPEA